MLIAKIFTEKELDDSVVKPYLTTAADGARRRQGLQTRRTWRSCDESRTKPSGVVRMKNGGAQERKDCE